MVVDAFLDSGIVAELLSRLVIVMKAIRPALGQPLRTTLDTEIVIALTCQGRPTPVTLESHLCQRHRGRDAVTQLLLHGRRGILGKELRSTAPA